MKINDKLMGDSGWINATLTSDFTLYNSNSVVQYRKIGKVVSIQGTVKPTAEIAANANTTIFTLPEEYRPSYEQNIVCQGSGVNKWLLTIRPSGTALCERYGTDSRIPIPTTAWLPFNATFMVD